MKSGRLNVFSTFDGMSCGQIALKELGMKVNKYYASEIDKHAIKQTQLNFENTIQLGDITGVRARDLERIDLFIGGSPCQGFSFAGKQLNFQDPRSKLFFEFVRLWHEIKEINPKAMFLLENVNMKKEHLAVINKHMGVFPVRINSNLVSAQNRDRFYWTNIKTKEVGLFSEVWADIPQPKDKQVFLKDISESKVCSKYFLSDKIFKGLLNHASKRNQDWTFNAANGKAKAITVSHLKQNLDSNYVCVAMRGRDPANPSNRKTGAPTKQRLEAKIDGKTNCITSVSKDNLLTNGERLRRLTPLECCRLQTIPDWYKWEVSDTQIYKMLGNGWTIEVIKHIFSFIE